MGDKKEARPRVERTRMRPSRAKAKPSSPSYGRSAPKGLRRRSARLRCATGFNQNLAERLSLST